MSEWNAGIYQISGYGEHVLWGGQKIAYKENTDRLRNEDKGRIYLFDLYSTFPWKKEFNSEPYKLCINCHDNIF